MRGKIGSPCNAGFYYVKWSGDSSFLTSRKLGLQRSVKQEEESLNMAIPVPYTSTVANSINNFSFQNVAYSQFTGVNVLRPLELLYFDF